MCTDGVCKTVESPVNNDGGYYNFGPSQANPLAPAAIAGSSAGVGGTFTGSSAGVGGTFAGSGAGVGGTLAGSSAGVGSNFVSSSAGTGAGGFSGVFGGNGGGSYTSVVCTNGFCQTSNS